MKKWDPFLLLIIISLIKASTSSCYLNNKGRLCALNDYSCLMGLQNQITTIESLLKQDMKTMFKSSFNVKIDLDNPYICTPLNYSSYVDYSYKTPITEKNCTKADKYNDCDWFFRETIYQIQLSTMRLLNKYDDNTRKLVKEILLFTENNTVNCYNMQFYGNYVLKIDDVLSNVDFNDINGFDKEYQKMITYMNEDLDNLKNCVLLEQKNQEVLFNNQTNKIDFTNKFLLILLGALISSLLTAVGWCFQNKICSEKDNKKLKKRRTSDSKHIDNLSPLVDESSKEFE